SGPTGPSRCPRPSRPETCGRDMLLKGSVASTSCAPAPAVPTRQVTSNVYYYANRLFGTFLDAVRPVPVEPGHRLLPGHRGHLRLAEADLGQQQVDHLGGSRPGRPRGHGPAGRDAVLHAPPELLRGDRELVPQDVLPQARPVVGAVRRVRHPGAQDPAVRQVQLVGAVVRP